MRIAQRVLAADLGQHANHPQLDPIGERRTRQAERRGHQAGNRRLGLGHGRPGLLEGRPHQELGERVELTAVDKHERRQVGVAGVPVEVPGGVRRRRDRPHGVAAEDHLARPAFARGQDHLSDIVERDLRAPLADERSDRLALEDQGGLHRRERLPVHRHEPRVVQQREIGIADLHHRDVLADVLAAVQGPYGEVGHALDEEGGEDVVIRLTGRRARDEEQDVARTGGAILAHPHLVELSGAGGDRCGNRDALPVGRGGTRAHHHDQQADSDEG